MSDSGWPAIAVAGAGAVGCFYGAMLARAGAPVTLIGRAQHVDAIRRDGLLLERVQGSERVHVQASTELSAMRGAQVVLFCVKSTDTETVAQEMLPYLAPGCTVVSLQNGVDNADRIHKSSGIDAVAAVVYVAVAMSAPGHVKHSGRGDLVLGPGADNIARMFERAEVPCRVSQNIAAELWAKMILNCAYNAISALGRATYGRMDASTPTRELMTRIVEETVAVAHAEGVPLDLPAMIDSTMKLASGMPGARSSMAQDLGRGRPTEIASLNGYLVRRAAAHGFDVPVNRTLTTLIELLEAEQ